MKLQQSFDTLYKLDFYEYSEFLKMIRDELTQQTKANDAIQLDIKPKTGFIPLSDLSIEWEPNRALFHFYDKY